MNKTPKRYIDWLFRDQSARRGDYVIAEAPNAPLLIFMICIVLSVVIYPGPVQKLLVIIAYSAFTVWSIMELRSGRSRFRRMLGGLGVIAIIGAVLLGLSI